jgi:hypothetical protein
MQALTLVTAIVTPLLVWATGIPMGYLRYLGLCCLVGAAFNAAMIGTGVLASNWRDLRFMTYIPLYLVYKMVRTSWITIEACYLEWRGAPRTWDGNVSGHATEIWRSPQATISYTSPSIEFNDAETVNLFQTA